MKSILKKIIPDSLLAARNSKKSFAQSGEDLIVSMALSALGLSENCTYLDIGANHPYALSNTYAFYKKGGRGLLIEPDPVLYKNLLRARPRDQGLNVGIGFGSDVEFAKLYVMSARVLNTFSKEEAFRIDAEGIYRIVDESDVELIPVNYLFENHLPKIPDFVSIDVEGLDFQILQSLDMNKYRPPIFCVETLEFRMSREGKKITKIIDLMQQNDYFVFADTYINTIFVDRSLW
jgi:FkbM family methyltransferase